MTRPSDPSRTRQVSAGDAWRCLSVRPPWAWATSVEGPDGKDVENRSGRTNWRGWVGIHSAKQWSERGKQDPRIHRLAGRQVLTLTTASLRTLAADPMAVIAACTENLAPPSSIITIARVVDCHLDEGCCRPWGESVYEQAGGHRITRVYHWVLADRRRVDPPLVVPRGYLGLWKPDPDLADELAGLVA